MGYSTVIFLLISSSLQYSREENTVSEIFYIPSDRPYQVLKEELRRLFYVGKNQLLYLMFENGIYVQLRKISHKRRFLFFCHLILNQSIALCFHPGSV